MKPVVAPCRIDIRCRGYPVVLIDGRPAALQLKRGLALLVYLSELARKVSRAQLAESLWPDADAQTSRARLRRLCHEVNHALGLDLVVGDADSLWLDAGAGTVDSDAARVRRSAQQWLTSPDDSPSRTALETLLEPDGHGLLEGFTVDADIFNAWLDVRRAEQTRLVVRALARAAEHLCACGQPALAAEAASRLIALDALADVGHVLLLTARSQLGDAAGVESAYFACADLLRQELGIRPSAVIEAAYGDARAQLAMLPAQRPGRAGRLPPIRFADASDGAVAYLELGSGEITLVIMFGLWSHLEVAWDEPGIRATLDRLARRYRVVLVDRRGTGLSERLALEQSVRAGVEDIDAVRRALGVEQLWLLGNSAGGAIAIEYAAAHAAHVQGLILYAASVRGTWAPDYPWALTPEQLAKWLQELQSSWGRATSLAQFAPSKVNDDAVVAWWARMLRQSTSRNSISPLLSAFGGMDVRERLPGLRAPTLIVQREGDRIVRAEVARYLASVISGSQLVMLPGDDHPLWWGDTAAALDAVDAFIAGVTAGAAAPAVDR